MESGHLIVITGPMFCGKSEELQRQIRRFRIAGKKCLVINHASDTRYNAEADCCTHNQQRMPALSTVALLPVVPSCLDYDVIGIDEGQFFTDLVDFADELTENKGKIVVVAALDGTFEGKPFGHVAELLAKSEQFKKLNAVCQTCGSDAAFTVRRTDYTGDTDIVAVGASDKYEAICRRCRRYRKC